LPPVPAVTRYSAFGLQRRRLPVWLLCAAVACACAAIVARAANPQAYAVQLAASGNAALDATLAATSELRSLQDTAPVSPFGLIVRARADVDRLHTVLESFGYYRSAVAVTIDGEPLDDPRLGEAISARPTGSVSRVAVKFQLGPLYHLRRIDIDGSLPDSARGALGLAAGEPAVAAAVLAGGARLLTALQDQGYAFAQVAAPVAYEDPSAPLLDLDFHVVAGPRVQVGAIRIVGLQRVHESLLRAKLRLHTGDAYSPQAIDRARRDLLSLGVFTAVSVRLGAAADSRGGVPVTFDVHERLRHAASVDAAYSSDLGGSGGITWTDRDVFGNAEQLDLAASVTNIGGTAATALGYDTSAQLLKPDFGRADQSLQFAVTALKQSLQAYQQTAVTGGATLTRKLSHDWSANLGVTGTQEAVAQEGNRYDYTLVAAPIGLTYDSTDLNSPLDDPLHGMRDSLSVTPTRSFGITSATFVITQVKLAAYFDLHELSLAAAGRSVIALRALAGLAQGAAEFSLPPDQRFYGGGSGTIRGYRYQAVGPQFADGNPIGGTAIIAGSIEFRQRFGTSFGAVAFVDGGQVSASLKPLPNVLRIGVGAGMRYYTPVGPIRVDVAVPTKRYSTHDDRFEIYVGLGQAF